MVIYTIGHSTRSHAALFDLLAENGIRRLVDVRSYPSSRHCPQWNEQEIRRATGMYRRLPALGGKRTPLPRSESLNNGWRNDSFRGYADYMQTTAFQVGMFDLLQMDIEGPIAIMCAEGVWWRCHRSMIADALVALDVEVGHIMAHDHVTSHTLRDFAVVQDGHVTYPGANLTIPFP